MKVILGLGSNVGNRELYLTKAIAELGKMFGAIKESPVYESEAVLLPGSPESWNSKFLNMAVMLDSDMQPEEILDIIKEIEVSTGRSSRKGKWAPREIDIDILAMEDLVIDHPNLKIPHEHLLDRPFALYLLADLYPDWKYPVKSKNYMKTAKELAKNLEVPVLFSGV